MKSLLASAKELEGIRVQLARLNANMEACKPDLSRQPGEDQNDYWRRLRRHEELARMATPP